MPKLKQGFKANLAGLLFSMKNCHMHCHAIIPRLIKVYISYAKDSFCIVDEQLNVDDDCAMFGHRVTDLGKTLNQPQLKQ